MKNLKIKSKYGNIYPTNIRIKRIYIIKAKIKNFFQKFFK